ncbi:uncharacterized protein LOC127734613 isoform X2 [Mytilus californianus]|uniref:uncharacterized protein LOC127734613 isoform X2 n=1 Tax=Mytilus californianus TaxID=6549 RepID=UPI00224585CE|nr:uncharacterized protein LOC127734613 isoform X2 [Mytilus californianus]
MSKKVQFASHYCDEYVRRLTESTFYKLSWHGQTSPKLCDFSFTGGESSEHRSYTVCFESLVFDLPYSMGNVELQVKNYTGSKSKWYYTRDDISIEKTCVKQAYMLTITIMLPNRYIEPLPKTYLVIKVTAFRFRDKKITPTSSNIGITVVSVVIFIVCAFGMFFCIKSGRGPRRGVESIGGGIACIGEAVCNCFKCECFDCTANLPSCDCDCENICKPCGECCTAWAGCCTTLILSVRGESHEDPSLETTGMNPIPQEPEQTHTSTLMPEPSVPPPDYNTLQGDSLTPPPSYETAIRYTPPSAPPTNQ